MNKSELISDKYISMNTSLHNRPGGWGKDGHKHVQEINSFRVTIIAKTVLDYGCGGGTLKPALQRTATDAITVMEYDPCIPGKDNLPGVKVDLVVSTDVLEHVEEDKIDNVINHIFTLATKGIYLVISTRPANAHLPDGTNAHVCLHPPSWWVKKLNRSGWLISSSYEEDMNDSAKEVTICLIKIR